jgi:hypothetical protein
MMNDKIHELYNMVKDCADLPSNFEQWNAMRKLIAEIHEQTKGNPAMEAALAPTVAFPRSTQQ